MNSQNLRLETVKPVVPSTDALPPAAVVTQHAFKIRDRQTKVRSRYRRRSRRGPNEEFQVRESTTGKEPQSWLHRLLSGWMFSLLMHFLLLLWLGSLITNVKTEGPLTLSFSTVDDEVANEFAIDISPMELEPIFDSAEGGGAFDSEVVAPDPTPTLQDEFQLDISPSISEPIFEDQLFEAAADHSIFDPVNIGSVGLDEQMGVGEKKGKGKSTRVKFFGLESAGNRFVFVIDCSGSMSDESRYQRAVYELMRSMDMLKTSHRFLVILYNSSTYPMLDMDENNVRMIPATRTNKKRVMDWLKVQRPQSVTLPMFAMKKSLELKPSSIYFLSDGEFFDRTIPMLHKFNIDDSSTGATKIPINTITLGSTGLGAPLMKRIANDSGGRFRWVQ